MRPLLPVVAAALLVAACAEDDGRASAGTDSPADAVQASASDAAAANDSDTAAAAAPSLAFDIQPVLDVHCVQCHLYESQQGGLMLEQGEAHAELVDAPSTQASMPRVVPGDPDGSYLMHKLRGTQLQAGGSGLRMPFGGEAGGSTLGAAQIELIADWIRAGAPDN